MDEVGSMIGIGMRSGGLRDHGYSGAAISGNLGIPVVGDAEFGE